MLFGAAFYRDRYRKTADGWKICATGYRAHLRGGAEVRRQGDARSGTGLITERIAITAPGCSQRMIFVGVASSSATQPAVGEPLLVWTKNAPPSPGMRSLLTPITIACA